MSTVRRYTADGVRVTAYACPNCRGYHLERRWCHVCDGAGFIKTYELVPPAEARQALSKFRGEDA